MIIALKTYPVISCLLNVFICHVGPIPEVNQTCEQETPGSTDLSYCQACGKKFSNSRALQRHQKTHVTAKTHKCSQCGEGFGYLNRLRKHNLIHTKEKPFPCPLSDTRFSRKDRLKEHLNTHNGWSAETKRVAETLDGKETLSCLIASSGAQMESNPEGQ